MKEDKSSASPISASSADSQKEDGEKKEEVLDIRFGTTVLLICLGLFILLFPLLNYFNIVSLSKVYPDTFGFLPHRPFVEKEIKISITPPPKLVDVSRGQLESCDIKKEGNPLVVDITREDDMVSGNYRGIINKITFNNQSKTSASIELVSLKGEQSHTFKVKDEDGLVYDYTLQKDLSLKDLKKGVSVGMTFNCFPKQSGLYKIVRIAIFARF